MAARMTEIPEEPTAVPAPEKIVLTKEEALGIPYLTVPMHELPSKGLPYPEGTVIRYRPFTFGEVKLVNAQKGNQRDLVRILLAGIDCGTFPSVDIPAMDFFYLALLRRTSTLPENTGWSFTSVCPRCHKPVRTRFTVRELDIRDLKEKTLPIIVSASGREIHLRPLTIDRFSSLGDLMQGTGKDFDLVVLSAMSDVEGLESFEEVYSFFSGLTDENEMEMLAEVQQRLDFGIAPLVRRCSNPSEKEGGKCGYKLVLNPHLEVEHLRPFREAAKSPDLGA